MKTVVLLCMLLFPVLVFAASEQISWDAITDATVVNVKVYQSTSSTATKPWTLVKTVTMPATVTTVPITAVGTYYWYLTASNALESVPSVVFSETWTAADFPPLAPTNPHGTKLP